MKKAQGGQAPLVGNPPRKPFVLWNGGSGGAKPSHWSEG
jgi:hypothetical protein